MVTQTSNLVQPRCHCNEAGQACPWRGRTFISPRPSLHSISPFVLFFLFSSLEILHLFHFHDALKTGLPHALVERGDPSWLSRGRLWAAAQTGPLMCTLLDPGVGAANRPVPDRSFGSSCVSPIPLSCGPLIISVAHSMLPLVYVGLMWVLAPVFSCHAVRFPTPMKLVCSEF